MMEQRTFDNKHTKNDQSKIPNFFFSIAYDKLIASFLVCIGKLMNYDSKIFSGT